MADHERTEVVPSAPATFDLGQPVADLHEGNEPVTWAGGSLELAEVAEHRPTSALHADPVRRKWMTGAIGGSVGLALILGFALSRGGKADVDEDDQDANAAVEIPSAPPEPEVVPEPVPEPAPKQAKPKKTSSRVATAPAKRDATLAGASEQAAESSASKPAASKPAATPTKPAATPSKPAAVPTPTPTPTPSKPVGPNLAPPDDEGTSTKAELPDVSGWDDEDAALGDRPDEVE